MVLQVYIIFSPQGQKAMAADFALAPFGAPGVKQSVAIYFSFTLLYLLIRKKSLNL